MKQLSISLPNILHMTRYAQYSDNFGEFIYGCRTLKLVLEKITFFNSLFYLCMSIASYCKKICVCNNKQADQ